MPAYRQKHFDAGAVAVGRGVREYQFQPNEKGEVISVLCDLAGHKSVAARK